MFPRDIHHQWSRVSIRSDRRPRTWLSIWDSRSKSLIRLIPRPLSYLIVIRASWHGLHLHQPLSDVALFSDI